MSISKKAIIIGGSSGIGKALSRILFNHGYMVGITGRRGNLLQVIKDELSSNNIYIKEFDVTSDKAGECLQDLIDEMGGVDLIVISAGTGHIDPELTWGKEKDTIDVNVVGFSHMLNIAYQNFKKQSRGHIVGISSVCAFRGTCCPSYSASKAFVSNYLEGVRIKSIKQGLDIVVTDVKPGFVDTPMARGDENDFFWMSSPEVAASQIFDAIVKRRKHVYVTKRWRLIAWILKIAPEFLLRKYF